MPPSPYQTLGDFLKAAKEKPGTLNVGTINVGGTQNLTAELFKAMAGIDVVIVPFRGSPDVVVALLRNDVQLAIDFYAALKTTLDGGKARDHRHQRAEALARAAEHSDGAGRRRRQFRRHGVERALCAGGHARRHSSRP